MRCGLSIFQTNFLKCADNRGTYTYRSNAVQFSHDVKYLFTSTRGWNNTEAKVELPRPHWSAMVPRSEMRPSLTIKHRSHLDLIVVFKLLSRRTRLAMNQKIDWIHVFEQYVGWIYVYIGLDTLKPLNQSGGCFDVWQCIALGADWLD